MAEDGRHQWHREINDPRWEKVKDDHQGLKQVDFVPGIGGEVDHQRNDPTIYEHKVAKKQEEYWVAGAAQANHHLALEVLQFDSLFPPQVPRAFDEDLMFSNELSSRRVDQVGCMIVYV